MALVRLERLVWPEPQQQRAGAQPEWQCAPGFYPWESELEPEKTRAVEQFIADMRDFPGAPAYRIQPIETPR